MARVTIEQAMQFGRQHHQAGRLAEAERIYRQVLSQQPNHAEALRIILGMLARQVDRNDVAVDLLGGRSRSILLMWRPITILASPCRAGDCWMRPSPHFRIRCAPALPGRRRDPLQSRNHAGQQWARTDEAIASYRQALHLRPTYPGAYEQPRQLPARKREHRRSHRLLQAGNAARPNFSRCVQ